MGDHAKKYIVRYVFQGKLEEKSYNFKESAIRHFAFVAKHDGCRNLEASPEVWDAVLGKKNRIRAVG